MWKLHKVGKGYLECNGAVGMVEALGLRKEVPNQLKWIMFWGKHHNLIQDVSFTTHTDIPFTQTKYVTSLKIPSKQFAVSPDAIPESPQHVELIVQAQPPSDVDGLPPCFPPVGCWCFLWLYQSWNSRIPRITRTKAAMPMLMKFSTV
jgi:hypothetical protein